MSEFRSLFEAARPLIDAVVTQGIGLAPAVDALLRAQPLKALTLAEIAAALPEPRPKTTRLMLALVALELGVPGIHRRTLMTEHGEVEVWWAEARIQGEAA